jgi:hypothetical protein
LVIEYYPYLKLPWNRCKVREFPHLSKQVSRHDGVV